MSEETCKASLKGIEEVNTLSALNACPPSDGPIPSPPGQRPADLGSLDPRPPHAALQPTGTPPRVIGSTDSNGGDVIERAQSAALPATNSRQHYPGSSGPSAGNSLEGIVRGW